MQTLEIPKTHCSAGRTNLEEVAAGTDSGNLDSDVDGIMDGLDQEPGVASNLCDGKHSGAAPGKYVKCPGWPELNHLAISCLYLSHI